MHQDFSECLRLRQENLLQVKEPGQADETIVGNFTQEFEVGLSCWSSEYSSSIRDKWYNALIRSDGSQDFIWGLGINDTDLGLGKMSQGTQKLGNYNALPEEPNYEVYTCCNEKYT